MSVIHNGILLGAGADAAAATGVSRSLRFDGGAYLSRTPGSAGNRKTFTFSCWVKRGNVGSGRYSLLVAATGGNNQTEFFFEQSTGVDKLHFYHYDGSYQGQCLTTAVYRDPSAWYHIVLAVDTTQATASNRCKIYVNGVQQDTTFTTNFTQNADLYVNAANAHTIGYDVGNGPSQSYYFDGYLADIYLLDGTATTPSTFAETDAITGQWVPKTPTGLTYGTNGFRLPFSDNSGTTSTTLGKDSAGSNNWTPNGFSVAAGSGNDSLVDSPSHSGTDTGAGNEVRGNYCTWNPLYGSTPTLSNGNLEATTSATTAYGSISVTSGKWYWEIAVTTASYLGVIDNTYTKTDNGWSSQVLAYQSSGNKYNGLSTSYGASYASGDVIGIALDMDNGTIAFYKNGSSQGTAFNSGVAGKELRPMVYSASSGVQTANFGQRAFAYTAPSGYKALCTANLPEPAVVKSNTAMDVALWTGTGSSRSITGLAFSPDLVWVKARSVAYGHRLADSIRGTTKLLATNGTDAEFTDATSLTAFNSDGFSVGASVNYNENSSTYAAWCFDCGSSTVTNTSGSISSQVRASATNGCSVVTYTGTGSAATVGHGCGAAPSLIITKRRNSTSNWGVYHRSIGATKYLLLNTTDAEQTSIAPWNDTAPTSTVFSVRDATFSNESASFTYVAYCFAPVASFSAFGQYTGNGSSDGPFVFTGFRPRWIMFKCASTNNGYTFWEIIDTARDNNLAADLSDAEGSYNLGTGRGVDILSNGFKIRGVGSGKNISSATYIYAAFAESPFKYSRAR